MVQSTFYQDLSKYEAKTRLGLSKKQIWIGIQMLPPMAIVVAPFLYPLGFAAMIAAVLVGAMWLFPLLLKFVGAYDKMKRQFIDFRLIIKDRQFRSEND